MKRFTIGLLVMSVAGFLSMEIADSAEPVSDSFTTFMKHVEDGEISKVVKLLASQPEFLNKKTHYGLTPLHQAAKNGDANMISMLLSRGAKVNSQDVNGASALYFGCRSGDLESVRLLLASGANPDAKTRIGKSSLQWSFEHGSNDLRSLLMTRSTELAAKQRDGTTLLHWAVDANRPADWALLLAKNKIDVNALNDNHETPLSIAAGKNNTPAVAALLSAGADPWVADLSGRTALHAAAWNGNAPLARLLLAKGGGDEWKKSTKRQYSPLHGAAWDGRLEVAALLITHGFDINAREEDGATPLHKAAWQGHADVVAILLNNNADASLKDDNGFTALDIALSRNKETAKKFASLKERSWGPEQMIGPPDCPQQAGSHAQAWASKNADDREEWVILHYKTAVTPASLHIHESNCTGAVFKVTAFDTKGNEVEAWKGKDPTPVNSGTGVSKIPLKIGFTSKRFKIYVDSVNVPGWNEFDAVELHDKSGGKQWAIDAEASTTYATGERPISPYIRVVELLK